MEKVRGFVNFENAIERIMARFEDKSYDATFTLEELQNWLGISSSDNIDRALKLLNDRLIDEHEICIEIDNGTNLLKVFVPFIYNDSPENFDEYEKDFFEDLYSADKEEFRDSVITFMRDVWQKVSDIDSSLQQLQLATLTSWLKTIPLFSINNIDISPTLIEEICNDKSETAQRILTVSCNAHGVDVDDFLEIMKEASMKGKDLAEVIPFPKKPKERGD